MLTFLFLLNGMAWANTLPCASINSYREFYYCSLQKHPRYEISNLKLQEGEAIVDKASQYANPDIGFKSVSGNSGGESVGSTELSLNLSVSQLWKRGPTMDIAQAEKKIFAIESQEILLTVKKDLIRNLFRLRQVDEELDLVNETISAFDTIKRQFRGRLARGPEQEITLSLVEMASGDYELKKNHLVTEKSEILAQLRALWGPKFEITKALLPPLKIKWPEISESKSIASSLEIQRIAAETDRAIAEQGLARSESWPNLSLGPVIERNTTGPSQYYSYGVNATVSLPILTINGGSRKLADARVQQAKLLSDYSLKKSQTEREILINRYKSSVESLKKASSRDEIAKKHNRIDGLFKQGLASGSLVIEAHRQINEFIASQHEHENSAIESYIEIQALGGQDIEEIFK